MSRLREFTIHWHDAWFHLGRGIVSVLVTGDGKIQIEFLVNHEKYTLDITNREDEFIHKIKKCNIEKIDNWSYQNNRVLDGDAWNLRISYDDVEIYSAGVNAYPAEFLKLFDFLHSEMGVPKCDIEMGMVIKKKAKWRGKTKERINLQYRKRLF